MFGMGKPAFEQLVKKSDVRALSAILRGKNKAQRLQSAEALLQESKAFETSLRGQMVAWPSD